jgi:hypothetical protein
MLPFAPAHASSHAAALVMSISGVTKPQLAVHREIPAGTRVNLALGSRLALLHYGTCSIVTLIGGTVTVSESDVEAEARDVESRKPGPCPKVHRIATAGPGPLGGVTVSRSIGPVPQEVAPGARVVLAGANAAKARSAAVLDSARQPVGARVEIRDASFTLDPTLVRRRTYTLALAFDGRTEPVEVPIAIAASGADGLLILRFE